MFGCSTGEGSGFKNFRRVSRGLDFRVYNLQVRVFDGFSGLVGFGRATTTQNGTWGFHCPLTFHS